MFYYKLIPTYTNGGENQKTINNILSEQILCLLFIQKYTPPQLTT